VIQIQPDGSVVFVSDPKRPGRIDITEDEWAKWSPPNDPIPLPRCVLIMIEEIG